MISENLSEMLNVPDRPSFEQAIALTQTLLQQMEQGQLSEEDLATTISALVSSENGARGFFVTYLTDDRPLADAPTPAVIQALSTAPEMVAPLLVKNLAMSTAMGISHRQNQNPELAQGSDRVQARTTRLIQALPLPPLRGQAQQLADSINTATGDYHGFLVRWGYSPEQQQAIRHQLDQAKLL
jgi:hypothetical protein